MPELWTTDQWIPTTKDPLPTLAEIRERHVAAARAYQAATAQVAAVTRRHAQEDAGLRDRMVAAARAGEDLGTIDPATGSLQREVELQVAREQEAEALLVLCDVVEQAARELGECRAELDAFIVERVRELGGDGDRVRQLLVGLSSGAVFGNVDAARRDASATLAGKRAAW